MSATVNLPTIERQVMCVTCKIPLDEAESPQAGRERAFIRSLIAQGHSEAQIKGALVGQYGPSVLALPRAHGFDAAVYIVPLAIVCVLVALLGVLLPRWRRRTHTAQTAQTAVQALSPEQEARLRADMARFD